MLQAYAFLAIAWFWEIEPPWFGYIAVLPALILSGLMLGALGLLLSSAHPPAGELCQRDELRHLSDVLCLLRFVSALAGSRKSSPILYCVCQVNPFTHAVELIRFALYGQLNWISLAVVGGCAAAFMTGAILSSDPIARPDPPRARRRRDIRLAYRGSEHCWRSVSAGSGFAADPRYPGLAVRAGKSAGDFAGRGVGRPTARRESQDKWKSNSRVAALVTKLSARRIPLEEAQKEITEFLGRPATGKNRRRQTAVRRPVRYAESRSVFPRS